MGLKRGLRSAPALAVALGTAGLVAPTAQGAPYGAVAMFSDPGDYIGLGGQRLFTSHNGAVHVSGDRRGLEVGVSGGTSGDDFYLDFAAAPGHKLKKGVYDDAQRAPFREAGHPGIDIGGSGRGCNSDSGRFEVKSISVRNHRVRDLWIVFEQHCEGDTPALFGEVRIGHRHAAAPSIVRWPPGERGQASTVVPVTFAPPKGFRARRAAIAGSGRSAFRVRDDECAGRSVSTSRPCQVWVRFQAGPGTHVARLRIASGSGRHADALLEGFNHGGRTRLVMHSDPGDFVGGGRSYRYTRKNADIAAYGNREDVTFTLTTPQRSLWSGHFYAGRGDILAPGTTYRTAGGNGASTPSFDVCGNGHDCDGVSGKFTVTRARYSSSGELRSFAVRFEQHYSHARAALHGTFQFRAGDRTRPPPWIRDR